MKNTLKEFRNFAIRGNVIDMAIGIIIGAAFGKIVDSLVKDIIMPPIGLFLGKVDFSNLFLVLNNPNPGMSYNTLSAAQTAGAVTLNLGIFINVIISFTIVAFAVFMLVKGINRLQAAAKKEEEAKAETTSRECPFCTSTINKSAKRCPFCTSKMEDIVKPKTITKKKV